MKSALAATAALLLATAAFTAQAQTAAAAFPYEADGAAAADTASAYLAAKARWHNELAAFARADQERFPQPGGVVFVGSSTVRMWTRLSQDFSRVPGGIVNRGFGGSTLADCALFARDLVVRYKPRQVVLYAGDNDLAEGRTPQQVLDSFVEFVERVRAELPDTRIAYLSIKPSPSRVALLPQAMQANALIAGYSANTPNLDFIDIYSRMLDAEGKPRTDLYSADALHMNPAGYAIWKTTITPHLLPQQPQAAGLNAAALQKTAVSARPAP